MDFTITSEQQAIIDSIRALMSDFGDDFWLERDDSGVFPEEFYQAMARVAGWASPCRKPTVAPASGCRRRR